MDMIQFPPRGKSYIEIGIEEQVISTRTGNPHPHPQSESKPEFFGEFILHDIVYWVDLSNSDSNRDNDHIDFLSQQEWLTRSNTLSIELEPNSSTWYSACPELKRIGLKPFWVDQVLNALKTRIHAMQRLRTNHGQASLVINLRVNIQWLTMVPVNEPSDDVGAKEAQMSSPPCKDGSSHHGRVRRWFNKSLFCGLM